MHKSKPFKSWNDFEGEFAEIFLKFILENSNIFPILSSKNSLYFSQNFVNFIRKIKKLNESFNKNSRLFKLFTNNFKKLKKCNLGEGRTVSKDYRVKHKISCPL